MIGSVLAALLDLSGTIINMVPSDDPEIIAEVEIENGPMNTPIDEGIYPLSLGEITIEVEFTWNVDAAAADRITVTPPTGVICEPADCSVLLLEEFKATILLKPYTGF